MSAIDHLMSTKLKLGVNIDHVATLRNARFVGMLESPYVEPCPIAAALVAEAAGADSITAHLREDRRHIRDRDIAELREKIGTKLNLEMGNTPEILAIAIATKPDFVCLVPEHRAEVTTEGGLDVVGSMAALRPTIARLQGAGILVSLFIDPVDEHIDASAELGVEMVELHTGTYANAAGEDRRAEAERLASGAGRAHPAGLQVNAGHGITTANLAGLFCVPHLAELNIGHHLISRSIGIGLEAAVREMVAAMDCYGSGVDLGDS